MTGYTEKMAFENRAEKDRTDREIFQRRLAILNRIEKNNKHYTPPVVINDPAIQNLHKRLQTHVVQNCNTSYVKLFDNIHQTLVNTKDTICEITLPTDGLLIDIECNIQPVKKNENVYIEPGYVLCLGVLHDTNQDGVPDACDLKPANMLRVVYKNRRVELTCNNPNAFIGANSYEIQRVSNNSFSDKNAKIQTIYKDNLTVGESYIQYIDTDISADHYYTYRVNIYRDEERACTSPSDPIIVLDSYDDIGYNDSICDIYNINTTPILHVDTNIVCDNIVSNVSKLVRYSGVEVSEIIPNSREIKKDTVIVNDVKMRSYIEKIPGLRFTSFNEPAFCICSYFDNRWCVKQEHVEDINFTLNKLFTEHNMSEILFFNPDISNEDIETLTQYIKNKYGIL